MTNERVAPDELADVLVAAWLLSGFDKLLPMTTALDRGLKSAIEKGAFPGWEKRLTASKACAELHFGQACTRIRFLEMAPALSFALRSGLLGAPDEQRYSFIRINSTAAEALLQRWEVEPAEGRLWGGTLRLEVEREIRLGDKHFGKDEPEETEGTSEGSEEDAKGA